jgi:hypothetical protein
MEWERNGSYKGFTWEEQGKKMRGGRNGIMKKSRIPCYGEEYGRVLFGL